MKKISLLSFLCLFVSFNAFGYSYEFEWYEQASSAVRQAWGNPSLSNGYIQDKTSGPGNFRIKDGWACCGSSAQDAENNNKDDQSIMVFSARDLYEHGGWFCINQFSAASGSSRFYLYKQQANWPGMNCALFCEPGWDGPGCSQKTNTDSPCNPTDFAEAIKEVKKNKYSGYDALALHKARMAVGHDFFVKSFINNFYPHVVILGATDFMQHGIVAQPVLLGIVGGHPKTTWITSGPGATGKTKVLCAQGFTKNDKCEISSKNCGSNIWCNGYSDSNFDSKIHNKQMQGLCNVIVCKDGSKALDTNFKCVDCENGQNGRCDVSGKDMFGRCVKCEVGKIFDSKTCGCKDARSVTTEIMQYGTGGANSTVLEQCWTKEGTEDFRNCVLGITPAPAEEEKKE